LKYHSFHRQIGLKHDGRGNIKQTIEQYANQIAELVDPPPERRDTTYLEAKDIAFDLAWAAISAASMHGVRETLEALDDARYLQRLAKKRHPGS
jgi:hypothetical protein